MTTFKGTTFKGTTFKGTTFKGTTSKGPSSKGPSFKASASSGRRSQISHDGPLTIADIATMVSDGPLPFRVTAFDGSQTGPTEAPGLQLNNRRGLTYLLTAPGDLGLVRAYVSGDIDFIRTHPADPYEMLKLMDDELHVRRPTAGEIKDLVGTLGLKTFLPVPPPPQETVPRWQRLAHGLGHSKKRDGVAISKHYDVSNTFYDYVLGASMTYTCAVFHSPDDSLEQAQEAKHALVFDKLGLQPGQRLLDVGCGWGSMVRHAARRGVQALGVTLSRQQAEWGQKAIVDEGLQHLAEIRHLDYRNVPETAFDAVSSIGLTEHIGVRNYPAYFRTLKDKLRPGGRLLNHSITRPDNFSAFKPEAFIDRYVFPDGELTGSGRIITVMQDVGFDVRHSENLREHYALTLREWCSNLQHNWDACVREVGEGTARVWGLYMAGSRLSFERNGIQLHQVLAVKPGAQGDAAVSLRPWWTG
jgi:cyclopropane-fatty-acyl-phospholipid synthase